ncbi:hypothetical protein KM043_004990 [Ampulex compressa]|nr:hypothetical protein KM043_004990 [Ampulex compressa]
MTRTIVRIEYSVQFLSGESRVRSLSDESRVWFLPPVAENSDAGLSPRTRTVGEEAEGRALVETWDRVERPPSGLPYPRCFSGIFTTPRSAFGPRTGLLGESTAEKGGQEPLVALLLSRLSGY